MIYIVLPAYNEEKNLKALFDGLKNQSWDFEYKVVLVDDGSTDGTQNIAEEMKKNIPTDIIKHEHNMGLGKALKSAFEYLKGKMQKDDIVITMDSDNTHPLDLISDMKSQIAQGADIVIASRFCNGGKTYGVPFYRNVLSYCAGIIFKIVFRIKNVNDYTSGFRAISGRLLKKYFDEAKIPLVAEIDFAAGTEMLLKLSKFTDNIKELPLVLRYDLKEGKSKMKVLKTITKYLKLLTSKV